MNKTYLSLLLGVLLLGAGCTAAVPDTAELPTAPADAPEMPLEEPVEEPVATISINGTLEDVTGGDALGVAIAHWYEDESRYQLLASSSTLPALEDGFFYEGWVVRADPQSVISTGALEQGETGAWVNDFSSDENLTDHVRYVLTLEPDDGDPAPAEHILDGTLE